MIIEFADPGYDWTAILITSGILGVLLLVPAFAGILHLLRNKRGNADIVVAIGLFAAVMWAILGVGAGGTIGGSNAYHDRVDIALYDKLNEAGFEGIEFDYVKDGPDTITALLDGEPFTGTIYNLHYPRDFAYKIVPAS